MFQRFRWTWIYTLTATLIGPGCIGARIQFQTVIAQAGEQPGGWQAACLEALFQNMTTRDSHVCLIGIGMPIFTRADGLMTSWDAAEIAAECITEAADRAVRPAPPSVPSAVACMNFKNELERTLHGRVIGSRVTLKCEAGIPHTQVGFAP